MAKVYQIAAIPIRRADAGAVEVLLITSRETRRWVVPKGWPWRKLKDHDAAAGEAWEEAGVRGRPNRNSVGTYTYDKRENGDYRPIKVVVYLLEVENIADTWPEAAERHRQWFSPEDAAALVDEPELKGLLLGLEALLLKAKVK